MIGTPPTTIAFLLEKIALCFEIVGVVSLIMGTIYTLFKWIKGIYYIQTEYLTIDYIRLGLGSSISLGLEFFLAGDIIRTIVTPNYYEIGILSILVVIRTVITYFLNKELASIRHMDKPLW